MTKSCWKIALAAVCAWGGDAERGKKLVRDELHCLECHSARGEGQRTAPDLAQAIRGNYSPVALASSLWNHTPEMWEQMSNRVVTRPLATDAEWDDVFAYLSSLRAPGRAAGEGPEGSRANGKRVFEKKRCVACHADQAGAAMSPRPGKAFTPYSMVALGWGPGRVMHSAMQKKGIRWPYLSPKDMANLVAFLSSGPGK